jgi:hypothetical protein
MSKKQQSVLSKIQEHCAEAEKETLAAFGEGGAHFFTDLWNDSFTITHALGQTYSEQERFESLLAFRLENCLTFSMELYWLHMLFSYANYPIVFQRLRFLWEMIYRAYYADCYGKSLAVEGDGPGRSIDDKAAWLESEEEKRRLDWRSVFEPVLREVFPDTRNGKFPEQSPRSIWKQLNKYVHPSAGLLDKMIDLDGMSMNRFNETWARRVHCQRC